MALACAVIALAELVGLSGAVATPHGSLRAYTASANPFFSAACLGGFFLFAARVRRGHAGVLSIVTAAVLGAVLEQVVWKYLRADVAFAWSSVGVGFGASAFIVAFIRALVMRDRDELVPGITAVFVPVFILLSNTFLDATVLLHPTVLDPQALWVESALGSDTGFALARFVTQHPNFAALLIAVYVLLPLACALVCLVEQEKGVERDVFVAFTVVGLLGFVCYHLCPVIGPQPFLPKLWPWTAPDIATIAPVSASDVSLDPRNCIPSLHTSWALMIFWHARARGKWMLGFGATFLVLTVLATVGLGQHYVIDICAAFPFAFAVRALFYNVVPWSRRERRSAVIFGAIVLMAWVLFVRAGAAVASHNHALVWLLTFVSIGGTFGLDWQLERARRDVETQAAAEIVADAVANVAAKPGAAPVSDPGMRLLWLPFALSGFAGLVYEVVFSKELALTFGSTARASTTVLATYMGGLALGSHLGATLARRLERAARAYALTEVGIAAITALTPAIFPLVRRAYVALAHGTPSDAAHLPLLQLGLGAIAILPPTLLMGMTTPFLVRHFERTRGRGVGISLGGLYGANTLGAAFGAILAGTMILPSFGIGRATWLAAGLNILAGISALVIDAFLRRTPPAITDVALGASQTAEETTAAESDESELIAARRERFVGYAILGIGGIVTLALETAYVHLLATVAGNSAYAFSLMLFCFLLGLGLGAALGRAWLAKHMDLVLGLAAAQVCVAICVLAGLFAWSGIPTYFGSFWGFARAVTFGEREFIRACVCGVTMLPVAVAIGAAYPLSMELVTRRESGARAIAVMGRAMVINTAGNIVGALVTTFLLLPHLGSVPTVTALALTSIALGVLALCAERGAPWRDRNELTMFASVVGLSLALLVARPRDLDWDELATGANVYFARQPWGHVVDHAESAEGGITSVAANQMEDGRRVLTLLTNGKFQGDDNPDGEMRAQLGFGLAPLLHTTARDRALVIGFGTGVSSRTIRDAGYRSIEIAELSRDMLTMADRHFGGVSDHVLSSPGVRSFVTDGRNHLLLSDNRYDLISIEISSIWFAGASSLYTHEFYELAATRLAPRGVLQQWMQLHRLSQENIAAIMRAVHEVFPQVWLYMVGQQGQLVACRADCMPTEAALAAIAGNPRLGIALEYFGGEPRRILEDRILDTAALEAFTAASSHGSAPPHTTDDSLYLEYSTPQGNVRPYRESLDENLALLRAFQPDSPLQSTRVRELMKPF